MVEFVGRQAMPVSQQTLTTKVEGFMCELSTEFAAYLTPWTTTQQKTKQEKLILLTH